MGGKAVQVPEYKSDLKLSLCAIRFDADKMEFGETVDTLVSASRINKSMLHPRVSPCGRFLLYTEVEYGSFSNYHKSSDLALYDLKIISRPKYGIRIEGTEMNKRLCNAH